MLEMATLNRDLNLFLMYMFVWQTGRHVFINWELLKQWKFGISSVANIMLIFRNHFKMGSKSKSISFQWITMLLRIAFIHSQFEHLSKAGNFSTQHMNRSFESWRNKKETAIRRILMVSKADKISENTKFWWALNEMWKPAVAAQFQFNRQDWKVSMPAANMYTNAAECITPCFFAFSFSLSLRDSSSKMTPILKN